MEEIMLATDVVLEAIIGPKGVSVENLISQAKNGNVQISFLHSVLYCAIKCIQQTDEIDTQRLADLLQFSQIIDDAPQYLGPKERKSWEPRQEEIEHWRKLALNAK